MKLSSRPSEENVQEFPVELVKDFCRKHHPNNPEYLERIPEFLRLTPKLISCTMGESPPDRLPYLPADLQVFIIRCFKGNAKHNIKPKMLNNLLNNLELQAAFETYAPNASEALRNLFKIQNAGHLHDIIGELFEDLIPHTFLKNLNRAKSLSDILNILSEDPEMSPSGVQRFVAEIELHFQKSVSNNHEIWRLIKEVACAIDHKKLNPEMLDRFAEIDFNPSDEIEFLDIPTETDIYNYLLVYFSLPKDDIPHEFAKRIIHSKSKVPVVDIRKAALNGSGLLEKGMLNEVSDDPVLMRKIINRVRLQLNQRFDAKLHEVVQIQAEVRSAAEKKQAEIKRIQSLREDALKEMNSNQNYSRIFAKSALYPIEDKDFDDLFEFGQLKCLSTYFDFAKLGIRNKVLCGKAKEFARQMQMNFEFFKKTCKDGILDYLEHRVCGEPRYFLRKHLYFDADGGTGAFQKFCKGYLKENDSVLVTDEVYIDLKKELKDKIKEKNINELPRYSGDKNDEEYKEAVMELIRSKGIKYMLIDELSRRGTVFPLQLLKEIRDELKDEGRTIYFILDGCQAFGRRKTEFGRIKPDVYFASSQKGSDLGPSGILLLSKSFVKNEGVEITNGGNRNELTMATFLFAANPKMADGKDLKDIPSIGERQESLQDLSCKFVKLTDAINQEKRSESIKILFPAHKYRDETGNPDEEAMTGIFECEVMGVSRSKMSVFAKKYGVHIADDYEDPASPNSFRIAFHPYMSNESIMLLGHVLMNVK